MAGVLVYASNAELVMELQTAAELIAEGRAIKTLMIEGSYNKANLKVKELFIAKTDISLADATGVAEIIRQVVQQLDCDIVLLSSDRRGKEIAGRLGQKLAAGVLTDISQIKVEGNRIIASRNSLGGAVVEESTLISNTQILAVAPRSFPEAAGVDGTINEVNVSVESKVKCLEVQPKESNSVDITSVSTLFAMGCGFEDQSDVDSVEELAKESGGAVGCSKPLATDRKWFADDRIIGISGQTCKPNLAVLMGISGQVQFWAGIRDAKIIVAVNHDENAPIMTMVDYALTADVKDFIDEFSQKLAKPQTVGTV